MSRESQRAFAVFSLLAGYTVLVFAVVLASGEGQPIVVAVAAGGAVLLAVMLGSSALGLARQSSWAESARTPLLLLLLLSGMVTFGIGLTSSRLELPLVALLAVWALRAGGSSPARPSTRTATAKGAAVVTLTALALGWSVPAQALLRPGGPLVTSAADLDLAASIICGPPDASGSLATVTYDWTWRRVEPLAGGSDRVVISWTEVVDGEPGEPVLIGDSTTAGIVQSNFAFGPQGKQVAYAVDLRENGFGPGSIELRLQAQPAPLEVGRHLEVRAFYTRAPADASGFERDGWWSSFGASASCDEWPTAADAAAG